MVYLEEVNIVHRDLAARNLLVDEFDAVKVVEELRFYVLIERLILE